MTDSTTPAARRGRRQLILLALVFFGPLLVAVAMYFTGIGRGDAGVNYGELLSPPAVLEDKAHFDLGIRGRWTLLVARDGACAEACEQALVDIRQVRLATGREIDRIERAVLLPAGEPLAARILAEHPGLRTFDGQSPLGALWTERALGEGVFLIDPVGNVILRYPMTPERKALLDDLKKLLKLSRIG